MLLPLLQPEMILPLLALLAGLVNTQPYLRSGMVQAAQVLMKLWTHDFYQWLLVQLE
jgi:hypothetical protein